ncbi:MAG: class I mannose-6-phosphate isomerase [Treponema sp.]
MFKTTPFVSEKVWGYERWIVSAHPAGLSAAANDTPGLGGKTLPEIIGTPYPVLIKIIQADETLSVQVHPDDEYAGLYENSAGKTECWYVLDAKPGATIVYGLNKTYSRSELEAAISGNTLENCLRFTPVAKGDFIFIPAGTVHAIQGGLRLLEVQQSSDITYRLYDWGRPREVHIQKGLDVIRRLPDSALTVEHPFTGKTGCQYFMLEKKDFTAGGSCSFAHFTTPAAQTGWCSICILAGSGSIQTAGLSPLRVEPEDCIMVEKERIVSVLPDEGTSLSLMMMG